MAKLTTAHRVFIVEKYFETKSLREVQRRFQERFPNRNVPSKSSIWRNITKYQRHGTSLNLNKEHSGRPKTATCDDNIEQVRELLINNPNVSARRNGLGMEY